MEVVIIHIPSRREIRRFRWSVEGRPFMPPCFVPDGNGTPGMLIDDATGNDLRYHNMSLGSDIKVKNSNI